MLTFTIYPSRLDAGDVYASLRAPDGETLWVSISSDSHDTQNQIDIVRNRMKIPFDVTVKM